MGDTALLGDGVRAAQAASRAQEERSADDCSTGIWGGYVGDIQYICGAVVVESAERATMRSLADAVGLYGFMRQDWGRF